MMKYVVIVIVIVMMMRVCCIKYLKMESDSWDTRSFPMQVDSLYSQYETIVHNNPGKAKGRHL